MKRKKKKNIRNRQSHSEDGLSQTGVMKQCGKLLLITASYQIFTVGVSQAITQPAASAPSQNISVLDTNSNKDLPAIIDRSTTNMLAGWVNPCGRCTICEGCISMIGPRITSPGPSIEEIAAQRRKEAHDLNEQGIEYYKEGNWQEAIKCFKAALEKTPNDQNILQNLKNASDNLAAELAAKEEQRRDRELQEREEEEALARLKNKLESDISAVEQKHFDLGERYIKAKNWTVAEKEFRKAIEYDPDWWGYRWKLAYVLEMQGRNDEAIESYMESIAKQEDQASDVSAYNNIGVILDREGKEKEAIEWYQKALNLDPTYSVARDNLANSADVFNQRGIEAYKEKDWNTALRYFNEAGKILPNEKRYQENIHFAEDQRDNANEDVHKIMDNLVENVDKVPMKTPPKVDDLEFMTVASDAVAKQEAPKSKAVDDAKANLYNTTVKGNHGAVFDKKGDKSPSSDLTVVVPVAAQPIQISERTKKDPRMIPDLKKLESLQVKLQKLDAERTQLAKERGSTKDPKKVTQFTEKLEKVEMKYQKNLLDEVKQIDKVKSLIKRYQLD